MEELIQDWKNNAANRKKEHKKLLNKLKKENKKEVDELAASLHKEVFEEIDCLNCANCCKTISPIVRDADIRRMARFLKIKETQLIEDYLLVDKEDYSMNSSPCPFLSPDNYCSIYEARPKACRSYPHINHQPFTGINNLHARNASSCPAVFHALERMKKYFPS